LAKKDDRNDDGTLGIDAVQRSCSPAEHGHAAADNAPGDYNAVEHAAADNDSHSYNHTDAHDHAADAHDHTHSHNPADGYDHSESHDCAADAHDDHAADTDHHATHADTH